jgi:anti-anti-sigma factor
VILRVQAKSLDEEHVKKLQTEVRAAGAQAGGLPVLIDLSLVRLLPSLTLGALVRMHSESRARQQRLVLCGMQPMVRQVMSITKLDRLLEVQDDLDAALKAVCP